MTNLENKLDHPKKNLNTLNKNLISSKFWSIKGQTKKIVKKCYVHNFFILLLQVDKKVILVVGLN